MEKEKINGICKNALFSLFIYALPVVLLFAILSINGERPWEGQHHAQNFGEGDTHSLFGILTLVFNNLSKGGLLVIMVVVGIVEFSFKLLKSKWNNNERILDIVSYFLPGLILKPVMTYFSLQLLPYVLPGLANVFSWVPFWWGFLIIAIADDLTAYWYHRLHHEIPFLWRFHRTHHSAPYMGMVMAARQNIIQMILYSQIYLLATLTYLGLGVSALFVRGIKSLITVFAHSSIKWDKPFYEKKWLRPIAWVMERVISTPATHHAHHANSNDDGIGHYVGNFGNMFFLWDIIFGTGKITRKYPAAYGITHYQQEEWYVQLFWPIFKSKKVGSELAVNGPEVYYEEIHGKKTEHNEDPAIVLERDYKAAIEETR
jgi:sterol desaturase/sphingolipid hydroxylase (fatty acid hydroxylase superfamily)